MVLASPADQLALLGGIPMISPGLHARWPDVRPQDRDAVLAVLDRGVLCGAHAPEISALEREWADYLGVRYCLALNSGTAALHCCAAAAGLGPGDEVIVPAFTFSASAMAMMHQGAIPVFCDVDPRTFNIDPARIEERISDRTRAILPVHLHGLVADMDPIHAVARRHGLAVVEDACQAHGATYKGVKAGALAPTAAFSLNATKSLSGGEGGFFVTDDASAFLTARRLSVFGEDVAALGPGEFRGYVSHGIGWNYRSQELSAAFARSQLRRVDAYIATAQANAAILTRGLSRLPGVIPPLAPADQTHTYHKYRVRLDPGQLGFSRPVTELRDRVLQALRAEGVDAVLWHNLPVPASPVFQRPLAPWQPGVEEVPLRPWDPAEYPVTSGILDDSMVLGGEATPLSVQSSDLMELYVLAVEKVLAHLDVLVAAPVGSVSVR